MRKAAARRIFTERLAGIAMLLAIGLGLFAANSSWSDVYNAIHHYPIRVGILPFVVESVLIDWINQGLLVIFFFHIGLHTKHELTFGTLARPGGTTLPASAALGGMLVPALVYLSVNVGDFEALKGWAVPIATDVVLALGLLSFFGSLVSPGMLAFITAVAIFDDLGAVIVIAVFYGEAHAGLPLTAIAVGLFGLAALNWFANSAVILYLLAGVILWLGLVGSGLEGAIAGAIVGMALPLSVFPKGGVYRAEHRIAPIALLGVVPIFAFFNSGVTLADIPADWMRDAIAIGVILSLLFGKPVGVLIGTFAAVRFGSCRLPEGIRWPDAVVASLFAGIGFTMSLFIVTASFDDQARANAAKLGVLIGSALSALLATIVLRLTIRTRRCS